MLQHHAVSQDQQVANVSHLTGVLRGERGGGVAYWSQNSYGTGGRWGGRIVGWWGRRGEGSRSRGREEKEGIEAEGREEEGGQSEQPCRVKPKHA